MILRKNRFVRIRVIGGSGIFDTILNIIKKPLVSKFLASAGKGAASMIGKRLAQKFIPQQAPVDFLPAQQTLVPIAPQAIQPPVPSSQATSLAPQAPLANSAASQAPTIQEILDKYKGSGTSTTKRAKRSSTTGVISIQDYIKGSGIKVI